MMMRRLIVLATLGCGVISSAAPAQPGRSEEIRSIRAEMARLAARLDKLEAEDGEAPRQPAPLESTAAAPSPTGLAPAGAGHTIPQALRDPGLALSESDYAALSSRTVAGATLDRALLPDGAAVELSASSDASSVAIKLARSVSEAAGQFGAYRTLALTASAPLVSASRFSDIGTLDGFIGGSKLRLQFSRYTRRITEPDLHPAYQALVETTRAACRARLGAEAKDCAPPLISSQFVHDYAPELETPLLAMARMTPGPNPRVDWSARAYGVELAVGYKKFEFLESGPVRKSDATRVPLSGKAFFSYLPDVRRNSLTGGIEFQLAYKDASAGALCPGAAPGAELQCLTAPIGGPRRTEKLLLSGEYRHKLVFDEHGIVPTLAISLLGTYDALNDDFGVDLPVYLVNDPKNGLTGGVRFGYTTSTDDFVAGVFVGSAFSLR